MKRMVTTLAFAVFSAALSAPASAQFDRLKQLLPQALEKGQQAIEKPLSKEVSPSTDTLPCINGICIGQALVDLPQGNWDKYLTFEVARNNPTVNRNLLDEAARKPKTEHPFILAVLTRAFDYSLVEYTKAKQADWPNGYCAAKVSLDGVFKDSAGRHVSVTVSGLQPPGKLPGLYVSSITKLFDDNIDRERLRVELRKVFPDIVEADGSDASLVAPVLFDSFNRALKLRLASAQRQTWESSAAASTACAARRQREEKQYQIQ